MPYCSNCGTQNPDTAKFCINCGAAMQITPGQSSSLPPRQLGIGSKVSFVAGDGKTYTGTVMEVKGDQYKIKYDSFNFDTWLTSNQFTVIAGTTTPPVFTPVSTTQTTYTNSSTPAATRGSATPFIAHLGFWGSVMIIVGFFLSWINSGYFFGQYSESISGLQIITYASDFLNTSNQNEFVIGLLVAIVVILLSALICLLYIIGIGVGRGAFSLFKVLPLLALVGIVVYIVVKIQQAGIPTDQSMMQDIFNTLGVGIYLTLAGSFLLAISKSRK